MRKLIASLVLLGLTSPVAAIAADAVRPQAVSYSATAPAVGTLRGGARTGAATGKKLKADDTSTLLLMAAAGVGGYFLADIIDDDNDSTVSP